MSERDDLIERLLKLHRETDIYELAEAADALSRTPDVEAVIEACAKLCEEYLKGTCPLDTMALYLPKAIRSLDRSQFNAAPGAASSAEPSQEDSGCPVAAPEPAPSLEHTQWFEDDPRPAAAPVEGVPEDEVERLSSILHDIYQKEARRQGDVRHHDDYSLLAENTKEYDRVLARFILGREVALRSRLEAALRGIEQVKRDRDLLGVVIRTGSIPPANLIRDEATEKSAHRMVQFHIEREEMLRENERLRKDAEGYRYLRNHERGIKVWVDDAYYSIQGNAIDGYCDITARDAALAAQDGQKRTET